MEIRVIISFYYLIILNKVFLPPSALHLLSNQQVPSPMIFCLQNNFENRMTFVGVLEFIAEEGNIILPSQVSSLLRF